MRSALRFFLATFALTTLGQPLPLTLKEVALMLRSGYSSESVLQEIAQRRMSEPLDEPAKKSLLEAGASARLIESLAGGAFLVSASEAEQAKAAAANAALVKEKAAEKVCREATAKLQAQRAQSAQAGPPPGTSLANSLKEKLVVSHNGVIGPADGSEFERKKLIALYFSAHWCAPCRKFTPQLVDYYNRVEPQHPEFEIVFVSYDRSRFNWETYLRDAAMPWPAIDYDQLDSVAGLKKIAGDGIPSLVLLDDTGHLLATSYDGAKYLGPQNVLAALDKIFAGGATGPIAQTR